MRSYHLLQVPNASPTAASASSDIYGVAVLNACQQIKSRMVPIASKHNHASFAEVILTLMNFVGNIMHLQVNIMNPIQLLDC